MEDLTTGDLDMGCRGRGLEEVYWNQSLSSASNGSPRFCWFLRLVSSSSSILTTGFASPPSTASAWLCLFPKRPIGLTPRPTYQNGSISGPGQNKKALILWKMLFFRLSGSLQSTAKYQKPSILYRIIEIDVILETCKQRYGEVSHD